MGDVLKYFDDDYCKENKLALTTAENYRHTALMFERWFRTEWNHDVEWHHIDHQVVNEFLISIEAGRSSFTVRSRKTGLMAILNSARRLGKCSFDAERIRRLRRGSTPKDFWSLKEVTELAKAADTLGGRFRATNIRKDFYARAYVLTVWDTALRRGDMALLEIGSIDSSLQFTHPRAKTGVTDICRINRETFRWIQMTFDQYNSNRTLLFPPWQRGRDALRPVSDLFGKLMLKAGLSASDSCLKKLVRSSIMEADGQAPGTGWLQGHHSDPNTTFQSYANRQRANLNRPLNRAIA